MIRLEQINSLNYEEQALLAHIIAEQEPKRFWLHFRLVTTFKKHKLREKLVAFHDRITEPGVPVYRSLCRKLGFKLTKPIQPVGPKLLLEKNV